MMGCVYFSVPVVLGYYASMWAISKSEATIHERFGDGSRMGPSRVAYEGMDFDCCVQPLLVLGCHVVLR